MRKLFHPLFCDETAQTEAEYAMLLVLILIVILVSIKLLGNNVNNHFDNIANSMS